MAKVLARIIQLVWTSGNIPRCWQLAHIILIAKSKKVDQPKEFRPIALLNTAGKVFFSLLNSRLQRFLVDNQYINISVQKGFIAGMPGCIEHIAKLDEILRDAKENKREICVVFLDLENAYGSVKHDLVQFALNWYHVPDWVQRLVFNYYERQIAQVGTADWTSAWFQLAIGVYQGCTCSCVLFICVFNLLLDALRTKQYLQLGYQIDASRCTGKRPRICR